MLDRVGSYMLKHTAFVRISVWFSEVKIQTKGINYSDK